MIPFERAMVVSYRLCIVTVALSLIIWPQFAIECLQCSNEHWVHHFGAKSGDEGSTDVSQMLIWSGRDMGLSYAREIVSISSAVWAQWTNMTVRQTMEQ